MNWLRASGSPANQDEGLSWYRSLPIWDAVQTSLSYNILWHQELSRWRSCHSEILRGYRENSRELAEERIPPSNFLAKCESARAQSGDWVLIKSWDVAPLTPKYEAPFQLLLTTNTAVWTREKGWTQNWASDTPWSRTRPSQVNRKIFPVDSNWKSRDFEITI